MDTPNLAAKVRPTSRSIFLLLPCDITRPADWQSAPVIGPLCHRLYRQIVKSVLFCESGGKLILELNS